MMHRTMFKLNQGVYWLFLGMWIGAIVMLIFAAGITFKTVRTFNPTIGIKPYNHELFSEPQTQSNIIAGGVTREVLHSLAGIGIVCGSIVLLSLLLQCTVFSRQLWPNSNKQLGLRCGWLNWFRVIMILLPLTNVAMHFDMANKMGALQDIRYNAEQEDSARAKAQHEFDKLHKKSVRMTSGSLFMLFAAAGISSFVLTRDPIKDELG
jgi:hypothetical protein